MLFFANIQENSETTKYNEAEKKMHKEIDRFTDLRIRQNREFFNVSPHVALDMLYGIASLLDDAEIIVYDNGKPIVKKEKEPTKSVKNDTEIEPATFKKARAKFKFSMCGIKVGEEVTFDPTGLVVKVASDDTIEYDGRIYKLSSFVGTFIPEEQRHPCGTYQGPLFFSYKGKVLNDIRIEKEEEKEVEAASFRKKRSPFKFSMCGIKVGEEVTFDPTGLTVKVASDDTIEYEDRIYKLSPFVGTFIPEEKRCPSNKYQGPIYFSYKGEILDKIRKERENINTEE